MTASKDASRKPRRPPKPDDLTDEEAADFYYTHRNDPDPDPADDSVQTKPAKRLSRVISVRFDPDEAAVIERHANDAGMTMSAYVRHAALGRPTTLTLDPASLERVREIITRVVTDNVADDLAHIRHKIGA